jgi:hypothetical protein
MFSGWSAILSSRHLALAVGSPGARPRPFKAYSPCSIRLILSQNVLAIAQCCKVTAFGDLDRGFGNLENSIPDFPLPNYPGPFLQP